MFQILIRCCSSRALAGQVSLLLCSRAARRTAIACRRNEAGNLCLFPGHSHHRGLLCFAVSPGRCEMLVINLPLTGRGLVMDLSLFGGCFADDWSLFCKNFLTARRSRASGWIFGFDRARFWRVMRPYLHRFGHEKEQRDTPRETLIAVPGAAKRCHRRNETASQLFEPFS